MKVANSQCIRRLSLRTLRANGTRNLIAIFAIALTALLFTSLFTVTLSINEGFQQANFRQVGGFSHGGFKYLTQEQFTELKEDPLIQSYGLRRFLGMPQDFPFQKSHVELGYSDANQAHWMYCDPVEGRLPEEHTNEAATDTHVLELLGVTPELGASFTITFDVDGHETTQTFTLCGWWKWDEAVTANHVLLPESRVNAILTEVGVDPAHSTSPQTGTWNMDVMLKSGSLHIEQDIEQILANHEYQSQSPAQPDYIATGINWGYSGAQLYNHMDADTSAIIAFMLLLILLTGYLIIYNVFQISVARDIRFYGLLKTIGTTPRQLKRIVRLQAFLLSAAGIPLGLLLGWLIGGRLVPVITAQLNGVIPVVSFSPALFLGAAAFTLLTVLLSCRRPERMAAKVSPVEALRYTEGENSTHKKKRIVKETSLWSMAWANLGRSRSKTAVTVLSLSLAVMLYTFTVIIANGFDMDKYLASSVVSDFLVADAGKLQHDGFFNGEQAISENTIAAIQAGGTIGDSGRVYGQVSGVQEFVDETYFRQKASNFTSQENIDQMVQFRDRNEDGLLAGDTQLYGMEPFALQHLTVIDGDLNKLYEDGAHNIAAVCMQDEYGNMIASSYPGDTVTLRYVEEYEYYFLDTGELIPVLDETVTNGNRPWSSRVKRYRDIEYQVVALVAVPNALGYRYYTLGSDAFVMNAETFLQDSGTNCVMYYCFDMANGDTSSMEAFLQDYTTNIDPMLDYESKATYAAHFYGFRSMFMLLGGALSFIVGLVGVLNFFNSIVTGITARRRELAVLQSIGMTGRQLQTMLALEGLLYTLGAAALALVLILLTAPLFGNALSDLFWFFSYRLTLWPIAIIVPVFALLGIAIPVLNCRTVQRRPVVERLRTE